MSELAPLVEAIHTGGVPVQVFLLTWLLFEVRQLKNMMIDLSARVFWLEQHSGVPLPTKVTK